MKRERLGNIPLSGAAVKFTDALAAFVFIVCPKRSKYSNYTKKFETQFGEYLRVRHAYSFLGGRISLSAILEALEVGEDDEVIVPAYNCVVVPNAVFYRRARILWADIDLKTFNIFPEEIDKLVTPKTRVVIIQHIFGIVANLDPILTAAKRHGLIVIEDCAHALGAQYRGQKVGTFGKAAFFSTEQSKVISTQMGGMAVTNDEELGKKLELIQKRAAFPSELEVRQRLWQFIGNYFCTRHHINFLLRSLFWQVIAPLVGAKEINSTTEQEIQSARPMDYGKRLPGSLAVLGIWQLRRIEKINARRIRSAKIYESAIKTFGAKTFLTPRCSKSIFLRYPIYVADKNKFVDCAHKLGLDPGVWFTSIAHPDGADLQKLGYLEGKCPNSEFAVKHIANLPTGCRMNMEKIQNIKQVMMHQKGLEDANISQAN